jgi:HlyD family secretion protein
MKTTTPLAPADLAKAIQASGSKGHFKRNAILGLIVIALSLGGWYWRSRIEKAKQQVPLYVTEPLTRGDVFLTITATGNLEPTNEVTVGSELSGITLEVNADINDRVTKGQQLAKLDTSKLLQQTESNRAAVRAAQARVTLAEATVKESAALLARQQELQRISGGKVPSKAIIDTAERAKADLLNTQAGVGTAEAQVRINENDLGRAIIKSPIDGIVLTRSIEPGQTVAASFTAPQLFVIAEKLERMILKVTIAEADIGRVEKGQKATFTVDAWPDRTYSAVVSVVSYGSAVTQNVVTYEADLDVSNDDLSLRPGMTATADIGVAASQNVFRVPTAALRFNPATAAKTGPAKKSFVQSLIPMPTRNRSRPEASDKDDKAKPAAHLYILRDGKAESIPIKAGLTDGRYTEVSGEGLSEGMLVILRNNTPAS